ncbi:outer membrane beta-barrel protein [Shewanella sp. TC10]|uniref:outer membrane beta-barrel protein n=1 Tax=Shewanella sp. TC10 TaxID=1419739 RepID=UPI00129D8506|nr:outer membrane beta-barrel protein [Shewanella sp. TC10]
MKIKQLILAGVVTSMMSVPAMASDWFVGGAAGYQKNTYKLDSSVDGEKEKERDMAYQLRVGKYINDNSRVYGTYGYNSEDIGKQQTFLLSYDYLVPLGQSNVNWFVGATAGMTHTSIKEANLSSGDNFVWGGQTGFMYNINENWSTEIGYQYLKQDYEKDVSNGANTSTFSLNDTQQVYLAIDYKF